MRVGIKAVQTQSDHNEPKFVSLNSPNERVTQDRFKSLRNWGALIILLAILSLIWFAITQIRYEEKGARLSFYSEIFAQWLEIDKTFITYPELRKYFSGQTLEQSSPNRDRVLAISDLTLDAMDNMLTFEVMAGYSREMVGWRLTFRRLLQNSPVTCERFRETASLFSSEFSTLARESCGIK
jgi:hypothetical protein